MTLEFSYRPEDLRQMAMITGEFRRAKNRRGWGAVIGMLIFVAYYLGMKYLWQHAGGKNPIEIWLHLLIPSLAVMVGGLAMGTLAMLGVGSNPRPTWRSAVSLISLVGLLVVINWTAKMSPNSSAAWPDWRIILPHSTWLFFMLLVLTFMLRGQFNQRIWNRQPELHRAKKAEITAEGVTISDDVSKLEYRWYAFVQSRETADNFLLLTSDRAGVIIPKRAFESEEQLTAMRNLVRLIHTGAPRGFEVILANAA